MQALHPLAMAGVDQHAAGAISSAGSPPPGTHHSHLRRPAGPEAAARVRPIHDRVRGTDAVTGRPYAAGDPALLLWVHGALVDSVPAAGNLVGTALPAADSSDVARW